MLSVREHADGITVESAGWRIEHLRRNGGALSSLSNAEAGAPNLLQAPATGALAVVQRQNARAEVVAYSERNERAPALRVEHAGTSRIVIVAEGAFRDEGGTAMPVGYRRRTEYLAHGLIWTTLELMSDCGCDGIVEFCALNLSFEERFERLFARLHPTQAGLPELFGAQGWFSCSEGAVDFQSRFPPLQWTLLGPAGSGRAIELLLPSDLVAWDHALKADAGMGQYLVLDGRSLSLSPYAVHTCAPASFRGHLALRCGMVLPDRLRTAAPAAPAPPKRFSPSVTQSDLASAGNHASVVLMDPVAGDPSLPALIAAAKAGGAAVFAGISLNELAAEDACFPRVSEWMHSASPALGPVSRRERGDGSPAGAMVCLKSGWFDEVQRRIDVLLSAGAWDGLYLADTAFHPCRHGAHAPGPFHSDVEGYLALLDFCRARVGEGRLWTDHTDGNVPTLFAGNLSDALFVDAGVPASFSTGRIVEA